MNNFIKDCINKKVKSSDINDYIDDWHNSNSELELYEFLGMSKKEYILFIKNEYELENIILNHVNNV